MGDIAIRVEGLGKRYRIGTSQAPYRTLRETLVDLATAPAKRVFATLRGQASPETTDTIWALRDVSFEVRQGEALGIIGRNGAGKSTLLKILSRITKPSEGKANLNGRVGSLLEVGTGFHHELTGRENIYLNGALLGMRRAEIEQKFDEIVAFAEIERFLDTPVKHYSSGMYVRLAFAVAAHLEPEIMLIDEVLAVGDLAFQRKCLGKMGQVAEEGRTIFFVSHNLTAIRRLCSRAILLVDGRLEQDGDASTVVDQYLRKEMAGAGDQPQLARSSDARGSLLGLAIGPAEGGYRGHVNAGEAWTVDVQFEAKETLRHCMVACGIVTSDGQVLHTFWSEPRDFRPGMYSIVFRYDELQLAAGIYKIALGLSTYEQTVHHVEEAGVLTVVDTPALRVLAIRTSGTGYILNHVPEEARRLVNR
jgi:lipopolysaccharide transport system ATP-binding protein